MDTCVGATGCSRCAGKACKLGQGALDDKLHRPAFSLPLPAAKLGAVELQKQQQVMLHVTDKFSRFWAPRQPA